MTDTNNNESLQSISDPGMSVQNACPNYGAYAQAAYVRPERRKTEFTRAELAYSFVTFFLAFAFARFAVCNTMGFITTAVFLLITAAAIIFMKSAGVKFDARSRITAALICLFSTVFSITANGFIKLLDAVFLILLGIWFMYQLGSKDRRIPRFLPLVMLQAALDFPFKHFSQGMEAVSQTAKKSRIGKNIGFIVIGLIVAVPLTAVVASLLMSADEGIEKMLGSIAEFLGSREMAALIGQLILAVPLSCYLFGLFYANAHRSADEELNEDRCSVQLQKLRAVQNVVLYAAVTPICFLYLLFFISQANYLFAAFSGNLPDGYSLAEYARKGFFELLAIVVINLAVISFISLAAKKSGGEKPLALKLYSMAICFFTLVIIASSLSKMAMYISVYGLTELRIYTGWFMILCALIFVMIAVKQFKFNLPIARALTAVFTVMFAVLCFSRPDAVIAKYNTEMSRAGRLPYYSPTYLLTLSDDAINVYLDNGGSAEEFLLDTRREAFKSDAYELMNISSLLLNEKLSQ